MTFMMDWKAASMAKMMRAMMSDATMTMTMLPCYSSQVGQDTLVTSSV